MDKVDLRETVKTPFWTPRFFQSVVRADRSCTFKPVPAENTDRFCYDLKICPSSLLGWGLDWSFR